MSDTWVDLFTKVLSIAKLKVLCWMREVKDLYVELLKKV